MPTRTNKVYPELTDKKILILGHGRHGKDTIGDLLAYTYGMYSCSSSMFAAQNIVMPYLRKAGIHYATVEECYKDRHCSTAMRAHWFKAISAYNAKEPHRLAVDLLETYDVYNGMRDPLELQGCLAHNLFDLIIWVDAGDRVPLEPETNMGIRYVPSMQYIDNSRTRFYANSQLRYIMDEFIERDQW